MHVAQDQSDIVCAVRKQLIKPHTNISLPVSLINHYFPLGMLYSSMTFATKYEVILVYIRVVVLALT